MKNTKQPTKMMIHWGIVIAILGICLYSYKHIHNWILADICLDSEGGVWDLDHNICRHDCLKWTKKEGCIPLNTPCDTYTDENGCQ